MQQPNIRRERNNRPRHHQIRQRNPSPARNALHMEIPVLPQRARNNRQKNSSRQHLHSRANHFRLRQWQHPRQRRRDRPAHRPNNQHHRARPLDRRASQVQRPAHQHAHSPQPDQKRRHQPQRQPLRPQNKNLGQRHERGYRRHHHRGQPRRHPLLRPEDRSVIPNKNQNRQHRHRTPLPPARPSLPTHPRPSIQRHSRDQEPDSRQQKRRHLPHPHPDRVKRRPPDKINNPKRQQRLPRRSMR